MSVPGFNRVLSQGLIVFCSFVLALARFVHRLMRFYAVSSRILGGLLWGSVKDPEGFCVCPRSESQSPGTLSLQTPTIPIKADLVLEPIIP